MSEATLVFDTIIVPAAISDYTVTKAPGKLGSERPLSLELHPAPKLLRQLRRRFKGLLVGFKAESQTTPEELEKRAREMMDSSDADMAVANDMAEVKEDTTRILIIPRKGGIRTFVGGKTEAADAVLDEVVKAL